MDVPKTSSPNPSITAEETVRLLSKLSRAVCSTALQEGLLAAAHDGQVEAAAPLAWALLELASEPADKPSGPPWSPFRIVAERRIRSSEQALAALVGAWTAIPKEALIAAFGAGERRWEGACRQALNDPRPQVRLNVASCVAQQADPALAELAGELLTDGSEEVARQAGLALLALAVQSRQRWWGDADRRAWQQLDESGLVKDAVARGTPLRSSVGADARVAAGIDRAMASFAAHRRRGVLLSVFIIGDRAFLRSEHGRPLREVLLSRDHPANGAIMSMLRAQPLSLCRRRALEWMVFPGMQRACLARLARADSALDHELVLGLAHLGFRPVRRSALRSIMSGGRAGAGGKGGGAAGPVPAPGTTPLSPGARRMIPCWSAAVGASAPQRHAVFEGLLADEDPVVRIACVRHGPASLLVDQVLDADSRVSRTAYTAWADMCEDRPAHNAAAMAERGRLLAMFARLPHPDVRAMAALDATFMSQASGASCAAVRALSEDRASTIARLAESLAGVSVKGVSHAIQAARRLGVVGDLEQQVRGLTTGAIEPRLAAQAVSALSDVASASAYQAVRGALWHVDSRVRANAVEALAKHARMGIGAWQATELKTDPHHRVRANAIRGALLSAIIGPGKAARTVEVKSGIVGGVVESLAAMLTDDRPEHRLAGTWLARRLLTTQGPVRRHPGWAGLVAHVAEAAQSDPEPRVRARATRCAQAIEAAMVAITSHGVSARADDARDLFSLDAGR